MQTVSQKQKIALKAGREYGRGVKVGGREFEEQWDDKCKQMCEKRREGKRGEKHYERRGKRGKQSLKRGRMNRGNIMHAND